MVMVDDNSTIDAQHVLRVVSFLQTCSAQHVRHVASFVRTFDDVSGHARTADVLTAVPMFVVVNDTFLTVSAA